MSLKFSPLNEILSVRYLMPPVKSEKLPSDMVMPNDIYGPRKLKWNHKLRVQHGQKKSVFLLCAHEHENL